MANIVHIDDYLIDPSDIIEYPKWKSAVNDTDNLYPDTGDFKLNNVSGAYSDMNPVSIFFSSNWKDRLVTVYDTEIEAYVWVGRIYNLEQNDSSRSLTVKTANFVVSLNTVKLVYEDTDVPIAEAIKNVLLYGGVPESFILSRKFDTLAAAHDLNSRYVDMSVAVEDNITCKAAIDELLTLCQCELYTINNIFHIDQWSEFAGSTGETVERQHIVPGSFKSWYDYEVYDNYNIAYKSGSSVAHADKTGGGEKVFVIPSKKPGDALADYPIIASNSGTAQWCGGLIYDRMKEPRKYFSLTLSEKLKYLQTANQIDLTYNTDTSEYLLEPAKITKMEADPNKHTIEIEGLFLNLPVNVISRDTTSPETPTLMSAFPNGKGQIVIKWTKNIDAIFSGCYVYFTGSPGEWLSEWCNLGKSPLDRKSIETSSDGYYQLNLGGLNPGTIYSFKVTAYGTNKVESAKSNILSIAASSGPNMYCCTGKASVGIYLDIANSMNGNPEEFTRYRDISGPFGNVITALYSDYAVIVAGASVIEWESSGEAGEIKFQYRTSENGLEYSEWSGAVDAVTIKSVALPNAKHTQYRFVFSSTSWSSEAYFKLRRIA